MAWRSKSGAARTRCISASAAWRKMACCAHQRAALHDAAFRARIISENESENKSAMNRRRNVMKNRRRAKKQ
jgi:hypothetical protein